jgi:phosphopentomutase
MLQDLMDLMCADDVLIISADHGCDPTFRGTDHTREYVPLLWYAPGRSSVDLGVREQFCDVASSVAAAFGVKNSFLGAEILHNR